jgi:hypothetical protein
MPLPARRRLPMVEVDGATPLIGECGAVTLLDAFEGRRMLIAYYFMWHTGHRAAEPCEGCTFYTSQVRELSFIHSRDVTYATFCQGPHAESARYRNFMGWKMPWYSVQDSLDTLLVGRRVGMMHIGCYLRQGSNVFETYWTTRRPGIRMTWEPAGAEPRLPFLRSSAKGRHEVGFDFSMARLRRHHQCALDQKGSRVCGARRAGRRRFLSWPRAASIGPQLRVKR